MTLARDIRGTNALMGSLQTATATAQAAATAAQATADLALSVVTSGTVTLSGYLIFVDADGSLKIKTPDNSLITLVEKT